MANKDFTTAENIDHEQSPKETPASPLPSAEEGEAAQIKNAHATGDGSFGRTDESLPDENKVEKNDKVEKDDNNY